MEDFSGSPGNKNRVTPHKHKGTSKNSWFCPSSLLSLGVPVSESPGHEDEWSTQRVLEGFTLPDSPSS